MSRHWVLPSVATAVAAAAAAALVAGDTASSPFLMPCCAHCFEAYIVSYLLIALSTSMRHIGLLVADCLNTSLHASTALAARKQLLDSLIDSIVQLLGDLYPLCVRRLTDLKPFGAAVPPWDREGKRQRKKMKGGRWNGGNRWRQ
jgi:hypothetical protein